MIYDSPADSDAIDQGDIIRDCPLVYFTAFDNADPNDSEIKSGLQRIVVLTQTCDLAQRKVSQVVVAVAVEADAIVASGQLKVADIRGPVRAGRVFGWYFLPADSSLGLPELVIDLRQIYTVKLPILEGLCREHRREGRIRPLFREHPAKHFADTYSLIGLPEPYATE
jgi:hypothetical protein